MDPMTIIVSIGIAVVGIQAFLTAMVYRRALGRSAATLRPTASMDVIPDPLSLSDLRRQRVRVMRALHGEDERRGRPGRVSPPVSAPEVAVPLSPAA